MKIDKDSYFLFSGGEVHCKLDKNVVDFTVMDYTMNGFMALAQKVQIARRNHYLKSLIRVTYPYFPYARQDRFINKDEPFSLKIFCDLLNSLELDRVTIYDPHSDVTPALINNCEVIAQDRLVREFLPFDLFEDPKVLFVSPDAGAFKKVSKLVNTTSRIVIGTKRRDSLGQIIDTDIFCEETINGKDCVVVDDICDGGRTFIELGKALQKCNAGKLSLYVTHGIFSKGLGELWNYYDKIHTTNSFPQIASPGKLIVHKLF